MIMLCRLSMVWVNTTQFRFVEYPPEDKEGVLAATSAHEESDSVIERKHS